jgi:hypothetical protein
VYLEPWPLTGWAWRSCDDLEVVLDLSIRCVETTQLCREEGLHGLESKFVTKILIPVISHPHDTEVLMSPWWEMGKRKR